MSSSSEEQVKSIEKRPESLEIVADLQHDSETEDRLEEYHLTGLKLVAIVGGLSPAILLMAIDTSIVATVCTSMAYFK